ncbi:MAG: pyruvate formate lyase family protein, partial [Clostridia bacterium]|nr:pyruvate formate lyase family protein [Clostridia bacterium]
LMRERTKKGDYVTDLCAVYDKYTKYTGEVAFFIEQVTGHLIPDFRKAIKVGLKNIIADLEAKIAVETDEEKKDTFEAMKIVLEATVVLANRYADIAALQKKKATVDRAAQLDVMEKTLRKVPEYGAESLYEAIQSFLLLWEVMTLEQAPNPFAFSVGNADRIFEPYRAMSGETREEAAELFRHFLVFFNVGDRSWAISQNVLVSGRDVDGNDLTNEMSYAIMDAYYDMNLPQPILSVKLHKNTPAKLYKEMGKFMFTPGVLTPSFFNDDTVFEALKGGGVDEKDLPDYSVAGCQEPLIMGQDNANTTNSWFNLPKILELTLTGGKSTITGEEIGTFVEYPDTKTLLENIREAFYKNAEKFAQEMADAANGASLALSHLRVPFLSAFMGGCESGIDTRHPERQGTKYNGSGCLIHGLSVIADSFMAIDKLLAERPEDCDKLIEAIKANFVGYEELRDFLKSAPKFGNGIESVDNEAAEIANRISDTVRSLKNYLGNNFRADWSSPSTHLLYGYWVGATPDGRLSRDMLGYGVDPLYGEAGNGLGFRTLSAMKLPYGKFNGGYASHLGIDPKYFKGADYEEKGEEFGEKILKPIFFNEKNENLSPSYLYFNITTPDTLRKVLAEPEKYAPSGVYSMRIHGTFVNFLDLSLAIQNDIITRLDLESTKI